MSDNTNTRFLRLGNPIVWGILSTGLTLGFAGWAALLPSCFSSADDQIACVTKLQYLISATPNEVGDTLAGFAGVLAFVWIIVTVSLQAQELRAQREELKLTRIEMEEQRKATQDMARSLAAQATIFEDEQRQRAEAESDRFLDQLIQSLLLEISSANFSSLSFYFSNSPDEASYDKSGKHISLRQYWPSNAENHEPYVKNTAEKFLIVGQEISDFLQRFRLVYPPGPSDMLADFIRLVSDIESIKGDLSNGQRERVRRLKLDGVREAAIALVNLHGIWGQKGEPITSDRFGKAP